MKNVFAVQHLLIKLVALIVLLWTDICDSASIAPRRPKHRVLTVVDAIEYLQRYGYMVEKYSVDESSSHSVSRAIFTDAMRLFQHFVGISQTGQLDAMTIELMGRSRCGNKDLVMRKGRNDLAITNALEYSSKWPKTELTYRIGHYPSAYQSRKVVVDKVIEKAFGMWSAVTPLKFVAKKEERREERVDIDIKFGGQCHGDQVPFDASGYNIAHAYYPRYGGVEVHFDDDDHWTLDSEQGINLLQMAVHELGHSLALNHSQVRGSVMAPIYDGYRPEFRLIMSDIQAIRGLYGQVVTANTHETIDPDHREPELCGNDNSIDAMTSFSDGTIFVFKGDHYWQGSRKGIADRYPRNITRDWMGLPGHLDAVVTWADGKTFFFKGDKYWRFKSMNMDKGYPKAISVGFPGIPFNIDAALVWGRRNRHTYFFKGNDYWRFDSLSEHPVGSHYPKAIKYLNDSANSIEGALKWSKGMTYFFKRNHYYRFEGHTQVDSIDKNDAFPRRDNWFHCRPIDWQGRYHQPKSVRVVDLDSVVDIDSDDDYYQTERTFSVNVLIVKIEKKDDREWLIPGHTDRKDKEDTCPCPNKGPISIGSIVYIFNSNPILMMLFIFWSIVVRICDLII